MTVPTGYQSQVEGDSGAGFTITNTYTPEMISITGQKTWDDKETKTASVLRRLRFVYWQMTLQLIR
ncbi:hypothetical protein [Streptococcus equi]|uniref:hypothetical protein n=1 Tax=Streptococcus equi TaxID=1336 RepID=UPI001E48BF2E